MNLNPKSPFSSRTLSELIGEHVREGDAWAHLLSLPKDGEYRPSDCFEGFGFAYCGYTTGPVPKFHRDWAAAGPLMERLAAMPPQGDIHLDHLGSGEANDDGEWGCGICCQPDAGEIDGVYAHRPMAPLAIRDWFIIAAVNAQKEG